MIVLDTHIWFWWIGDSPRLKQRQRELIALHEPEGFGISAISVWELAKKHELGKFELDRPIDEWLLEAVGHPSLQVLPLTTDILVESTRLPDGFRSDPADEMIIATSRILGLPLLTADEKILSYAHVETLR